MIQCLVTGG